MKCPTSFGRFDRQSIKKMLSITALTIVETERKLEVTLADLYKHLKKLFQLLIPHGPVETCGLASCLTLPGGRVRFWI